MNTIILQGLGGALLIAQGYSSGTPPAPPAPSIVWIEPQRVLTWIVPK
jgi:hypothetical protein